MPDKAFPEDTASPTKVREYIAWVLEHGQEYSTEEAEEIAKKWERRMGHELGGLSADELGSVLGPQHVRGLLFLRDRAAQAAKSWQTYKPKESSNTGMYVFVVVIAIFFWTGMVLNRLPGIIAVGRPRTCR